ncbi:MAG: Rpn family recombination-promoting nuclease/putative transposase [Cyclobacteriaceae bacterium]
MSQDFDKIFKENIAELILPLSEKLLNLKIVHNHTMKDKLQSTIEREPDYLSKIQLENGDEFILHLEFQTQDKKNMVYRMQEYYSILLKKYQIPVIQKVIYFGKKSPKMKTSLTKEEIFSGFDLINLRDIPFDVLLNSSVPEEFILSILGDLRDNDPEEVILNILQKLKETNQDQIVFQKYVKQLVILSKLRNLSEVTKSTVKQMPIVYDIKKDAFYKEGLEDGLEKGIEKGLEKGLEKGKEEIILQFIKSGELSFLKIAEITNVPLEKIESLARSVK